MTGKTRRNDPCPCGSGRKFKKCCNAPGGGARVRSFPHTQADRESAWGKVDRVLAALWEPEEHEAAEEFWRRYADREGELTDELMGISDDVYETWLAFDRRLADGRRLVDDILEEATMRAGERSYLTAMRDSSMRLYEVTDAVAGSSITLRDLVEGDTVTVGERMASRAVTTHQCLAARVVPRGCSGRPEIERGILHIPDLVREPLLAALEQNRRTLLASHPGARTDDLYELAPPLFHDAWLSCIFEPPVPRLTNRDGEDLVITRASFAVDDDAALRRALDTAQGEGIARRADADWLWSRAGDPLGTIRLRGGSLTLETASVQGGARGRELLERLAGRAIRHRATSHEDMRRKVMEAQTARILGRDDAAAARPRSEIDPDLAEAVVLQELAAHYRAWIDEPVPALDGRTPREAAERPDQRPRVEDLIRGLEGMYERALKDREPAYDPSWMRAELGLEAETDPSCPPPLAHERVAERVPGSAEASRAAAERRRAMPSFADGSTTLDEEDLAGDLELQRFLRRGRASDGDAGQDGALAAPYLLLMVNLDLHRRKVFWVDAGLSYMLETTDVSLEGRELRVPFPSFAIVLTDRHALSLGERLLARRADDPLRGQILRVTTVYVTERHGPEGRALSIVFAFDALGEDLPSLVRHELPAYDERSLQASLDSVAPRPATDPQAPDIDPVRALLRLVLNSVLYATSAGITPEERVVATRRPHARSRQAATSVSDSVFFLPGTIDIRRVRQLQALDRAPEGRPMLARFLVRGHWRRPAKSWKDRRLRWIEPYWKGPDLAAVIEKAYRLRA